MGGEGSGRRPDVTKKVLNELATKQPYLSPVSNALVLPNLSGVKHEINEGTSDILSDLDDRWVNVTGDSMSGALDVNAKIGTGDSLTTANKERALNLCSTDAVMRILRIGGAFFDPSIEFINRATADGSDVVKWDMFAKQSDKSFSIRDRTTTDKIRLTFSSAGGVQFPGLTTNGFIKTSGGTGTLSIDTATYEPTITAGTTAQYWRGDKSWQTLPTTAPGGSDTHIQYNDGGVFGGEAAFTYNKTTNYLKLIAADTTSIFDVDGTTAPYTSPNTASTGLAWSRAYSGSYTASAATSSALFDLQISDQCTSTGTAGFAANRSIFGFKKTVTLPNAQAFNKYDDSFGITHAWYCDYNSFTASNYTSNNKSNHSFYGTYNIVGGTYTHNRTTAGTATYAYYGGYYSASPSIYHSGTGGALLNSNVYGLYCSGYGTKTGSAGTASRYSLYLGLAQGGDTNANWAMYNGAGATGHIFMGVDNIVAKWGTGFDSQITFTGTQFQIQSDVVTATDSLLLRGGTNGILFNIGATQEMSLSATLLDVSSNDITHTGDLYWTGDGSGVPYGSCYGDHIGWSQATAVQNTYYEIADADMADGQLNGFTHDGNGKLTAARAGRYLINYTITYETSVANDHIETAISVSGTENAAGKAHNEDVVPNTENHLSGTAILDLAASATIEVSIRTTDAGTPTLSVQDLNITAIMVGGT